MWPKMNPCDQNEKMVIMKRMNYKEGRSPHRYTARKSLLRFINIRVTSFP